MAETPWQWSPTARRYRDTSTGRFLSAAKLTELRDTYNTARQQTLRALTSRLTSGDLTLPEWVTQMRAEIKSTFLAEYLAGRGGRNVMTAADFGRVGAMLRSQYSYLQQFAADIAAGRLTIAEAEARAILYAASSTQAFEQGKAAAWGVSLPAYPGDGSTLCRARCRCVVRLEHGDGVVNAFWRLRPGENCATCVDRAETWNPLVLATA